MTLIESENAVRIVNYDKSSWEYGKYKENDRQIDIDENAYMFIYAYISIYEKKEKIYTKVGYVHAFVHLNGL